MLASKDVSYETLFAILSIVEIGNIALAFLTNALLMWIVWRCSKKELGGYRYLLFSLTINDMYFPLVHALTFPVICSYRDAFLMFAKGVLNSKFAVCLFAASHSQAMPIMAHLFIYRLIALKWSGLLRFYTARNASLLVLATVIAQQNLWFWNCWFNYGSDVELSAYVQPYLNENFPGEGSGHIGALYYNEHGLRLSALFATLGFDAIMTFWSTVIVVCAVMILRFLRHTGNTLSLKTERLQRQLFLTLVIQMIVPFFCVYLPCAAIINAPLFFHLSISPNFISCALTFFPTMDALITIFGVKSYRYYLLSFFCPAKFGTNSSVASIQKRSAASQIRTTR